ncbi:hypothetical protein SBA4_30019 [Candidatus Sulfopaludibacter sp. SbA4]|nr:hypothetical protein SBA4_30019 [Candidatus Sulfopaludibacter sp. SbA4]
MARERRYNVAYGAGCCGHPAPGLGYRPFRIVSFSLTVTTKVTIFSHKVSMGPHLLLLRRVGKPGSLPRAFPWKLQCFAGKQPALLPNPLGRGIPPKG